MAPPGGSSIKSAAPASVLDAFEVMHCINTLHTILQSPDGGLFNPPYLPLAPRIPPGAHQFVFFSPFFTFFCMSIFCQKLEVSKVSFLRDFMIFPVFARQLFLDFKGLGPPPGLILVSFFCTTPFLLVFLIIFCKESQKAKK